MGSERWLDNQFISHVSFEQIKLAVLSIALKLANTFVSNIKCLIANEQLDRAITPLN